MKNNFRSFLSLATCLTFLATMSFLTHTVTWAEKQDKKYRRIGKRTHSLRLNVNLDFDISRFGLNPDIDLSYLYNFGSFELGLNPVYKERDFALSLLTEYNFVKNKGVKRMIPTLGLRLGATSMFREFVLGPYFIYKHFLLRRTALFLSVDLLFSDRWNDLSRFRWASAPNVKVGMGFINYFK